jgi:hypothetical protein
MSKLRPWLAGIVKYSGKAEGSQVAVEVQFGFSPPLRGPRAACGRGGGLGMTYCRRKTI